MDDPDPSVDDAEELARLVARRVEAGRDDGTYPAGLVDELDAHWRRVVGRRKEVTVERVHRALDSYMADAAFSVPAPGVGSGAPGGSAVHKLVGKTVNRHMTDLVLQLDDFARCVQEMFSAIVEVLDEVPALRADLVGQLESMEGRVAEFTRTINSLGSLARERSPLDEL